jgi:hypothetical protein
MTKYEIEYKGRSYTITLDYNEGMHLEVRLYNASGKHMGTYNNLKELFDEKFKAIENPAEYLK